MSDGTNGLRFWKNQKEQDPMSRDFSSEFGSMTMDDEDGINRTYEATCFPTGSALACSWDRGLAQEIAAAVANECKSHEVGMLFGPAMNTRRHPLDCRGFEYFSEDPCLAGEMAGNYVIGLQENEVSGTLKHFVCNNQNTAPQEGADGAFRSSIIYINAAGWMSNNLIVNNSSTGLLLYMNSGQLVNSTVANNVGSVYATQGSYATLYNSIVLNNTPTNNDLEIVIADAGSFFMNNCALTTDVTGGDEAYIIGNIVVPADGTFKAPTTFVGADAAQAEAIAAADFSLADGSACIGAGDPDYENSLFMNQTWINRFMSYDLAMNNRLTDGAVNIGAYEGDAINGIDGSNVAAADLATVYVDGNVLTVVAENAASVEVYSLNGALVAQDVVNGAANIALPQAGLYIVKVVAGGDAQSFKVLARN